MQHIDETSEQENRTATCSDEEGTIQARVRGPELRVRDKNRNQKSRTGKSMPQ